MELATAMEIANRNTRDLSAGNLTEKPEESQVHRVTQDPPKQPPRDLKRPTKECYRCGGQFHDPDKCRYKDEECYKCRKKGHKASQCLSKRKSEFRKSGKFGNTHHLEATDDSGEEECEEYTMFHINAGERTVSSGATTKQSSDEHGSGHWRRCYDHQRRNLQQNYCRESGEDPKAIGNC